MTPERYQQVKRAFRETLAAPTTEQRLFLEHLRATDPDLHSQIIALLEADALPSSPLDSVPVGAEFRTRTRALSFTATRH